MSGVIVLLPSTSLIYNEDDALLDLSGLEIGS